MSTRPSGHAHQNPFKVGKRRTDLCIDKLRTFFKVASDVAHIGPRIP
jgi:hypothetical protein